MRTIHWNGERWYVSEQSLVARARRWLVWFGGWEKANGAGWDIKGSPAPVSLFGHRFTHYGWGWQAATSGGWLVYTKRCPATGKPALFISRDGTPGRAHTWLFGAPPQVETAARERRVCADYPRAVA